ncbi:MAG: ATP-dependent Clp protease ATP-binding subunit, partial [Bacteroidales bacterium]|nr:ATP-dependent Clp protease ATP-binding subunit [Bacteroidales bacterium]
MDSQFSPRIKDIIGYSREEALRLGNDYIGQEHLFLGILRDGEGIATDILENLGVNLKDIKQLIEKKIRTDKPINGNVDLMMLKSTEKALKLVYLEARWFKSPYANSGHLLLAILKDSDSIVTQLLLEFGVNYTAVRTQLKEFNNPSARSDFPESEDDDPIGPFSRRPGSGQGARRGPVPKSDTPVLDNFGTDITRLAEDNTLDPIVGRDIEIERLAQILSRRKKNNPILIGEPGVGKSAIAEGLALRIVQKKVSRLLFDKRVVSLDIASIVAGTKYRGQFEERMKAILNELTKVNNIILFIDEIHTIVGAGGATGSLDAANMLKPALARGEIQCIGATTLDEYRQHIEKDGALERRFQKVLVEPTTIDETIEILKNIKSRYEDHHNVIYTPEAIEACVKLTARYISDRYLPDKAIDALDETGSRVHITNINVPERIVKLEEKIEQAKEDKIAAVKSQNFELAANYRDKEKNLLQLLENEKEEWEK